MGRPRGVVIGDGQGSCMAMLMRKKKKKKKIQDPYMAELIDAKY